MAAPSLLALALGQPHVSIEWLSRQGGEESRLQIAFMNKPIRFAFLRRLGIRRQPAYFNYGWAVYDVATNSKLGTAIADPYQRHELYSSSFATTVSIIFMEKARNGLQTFARDNGRGVALLSPGTYRLEVMIFEEGNADLEKRQSLVGTSLDLLQWL